jgi:hypothetical protein
MFVYDAAYALPKAPICRSSVVRSNISKRNAMQPHYCIKILGNISDVDQFLKEEEFEEHVMMGAEKYNEGF